MPGLGRPNAVLRSAAENGWDCRGDTEKIREGQEVMIGFSLRGCEGLQRREVERSFQPEPQVYDCGGACKEGPPLERPRLGRWRLSPPLLSLAVSSADPLHQVQSS